MDQGDARAKFKGKSNSYNGQCEYPQVAENPRSHRKSRLQARISASLLSRFESNRTFLAHLKRKIGALQQSFESIFDAIQYVLAN